MKKVSKHKIEINHAINNKSNYASLTAYRESKLVRIN